MFGLGGALGMYFYRNRAIFGRRSDHVLKQLWQTLVMNLAYGLMNPRIDNWWVGRGAGEGRRREVVKGARRV